MPTSITYRARKPGFLGMVGIDRHLSNFNFKHSYNWFNGVQKCRQTLFEEMKNESD